MMVPNSSTLVCTDLYHIYNKIQFILSIRFDEFCNILQEFVCRCCLSAVISLFLVFVLGTRLWVMCMVLKLSMHLNQFMAVSVRLSIVAAGCLVEFPQAETLDSRLFGIILL
ncbi:hypothetical protein SAY86_018262 [Trapa natans]|uniref:Uncharacterized protein n=1 Tax=Trapa natans TaxID=22666 RepID=A0AAN7LFZ0_TRANT|nr:hypothetical protein SAY86_018262 [Trapa natans]